MAQTTVYTCDICKQRKSNGDLAKINVKTDGIRIKGGGYSGISGEEGLQETENKLIHIGKPIEFDEEVFLKELEELREIANEDSAKIRQKVQKIVPTYVIKETE